MNISIDYSAFSAHQFGLNVAAALQVPAVRVQVDSVEDLSFACPGNCTTYEWHMPVTRVLASMGTTNYLCYGFKFDNSSSMQAIRFDPVINPESSDIVHHMVIYTLESPAQEGI